MDTLPFEESVWCVIGVNKFDNVLLGGIYRSVSLNNSNNNDYMLQLINSAVAKNCKHLFIAGDFNYPEIDWNIWCTSRSINHDSFKFLECLHDNYLHQSINKPTRYREGQANNILDLFLCNSEEWITSIEYMNHLGASDHIQLLAYCDCNIEKISLITEKRQFYKGDYNKAREDFSMVDWSRMNSMDVQESFDFICGEVKTCIDNNVPIKKQNNYFSKKPKWMDKYCLTAVRAKYKAWQRYIHSHSQKNYHEYCKCRNHATKAVRFARKRHEKGIADSAKDNPKAFWAYVNSKTKVRLGIGDLRNDKGELKSSNSDKANILNDFFASVFTEEGDSDIKNIKSRSLNSLQSVDIDTDKVKKLLCGLNPTKSCGPDECHPCLLKEAADVLSTPIYHLFSNSLETGTLPYQWKEANVTCIFKKGDKTLPGNYRPVSLTSVLCKTRRNNEAFED